MTKQENRFGSALRALAVALGLSVTTVAQGAAGPSSQEGSVSVPVVTDVQGDAHFVNCQGTNPHPQDGCPIAEGPDGGSASIPSADLLAIWYETMWRQVVERNDAGQITFVRHVADGVRVHFKTAAPAKPTFGPGVVMRLPAAVGTCGITWELWIGGTGQGTPLERAEGGELLLGCRGNARLSGGVTFAGPVATISLPFSSLTGQTAGFLHPGEWIDPHATSRPHLRTQHGLQVPAVDETKRGTTSFEVGSDLPPDIDCSQTPADPACQG